MPHFPKPFFRKSRKLWYVQIDGKQINLGPDEELAFLKYHQLMGQPKKRPVARDDSLPFIIDAFLEWVQKHRAADTYEWYRCRLQRFVDRYPNLLISELRPFHVENWADSYDHAVTSRRNNLRSVKRCIKWAKQQGYIDSNPITDLEVPAAEAKEVYISPSEFEVLLGFVRNRNLMDLMEVTYVTGCRPQELLRVTAKEVDPRNQRWVFSKTNSKGKKLSRVVYLPEKAMAITNRLVAMNDDGKPLFRNSKGKPWTKDSVNCGFLAVQMRMGKTKMEECGERISEEAIHALIPFLDSNKTVNGKPVAKTVAELRCEAKRKLTHKKAGELAPRYSLYALRHSFATNALLRGVDPLTVAVLLGHQDPSTLSKVYQHVALNPEHMLEQAKRATS